ncbi:murein transglycosylase [bacterium]|nr:murein transglycosylase [bacterium]
MRAALLALLLGLASLMAAHAQVLDFESLPDWGKDDHLAALQSFQRTCDLMDQPDWQPICRLAATVAPDEAAARAFFELLFRPVLVGTPPALFTGYYEPVLQGSPVRTARFAWPIYRRPPELRDGAVWYDRATIERGILNGRGLEIAWLDDPVEVFFLHIQGSGRIQMTDGRVIRVGYAGRNGYAYRSIGSILVQRGYMSQDQLSAESIRNWVRSNPSVGASILDLNPSYIFFRKLPDLAADQGPIGAMGRSITPMRSVAVDPAHVPLGTPVWIEKDGTDPMHHLMVAQDTGGAIKGAQRADIFYGTGRAAGLAAGSIKDPGRLIMLLPIDRAFAMLPDG